MLGGLSAEGSTLCADRDIVALVPEVEAVEELGHFHPDALGFDSAGCWGLG